MVQLLNGSNNGYMSNIPMADNMRTVNYFYHWLISLLIVQGVVACTPEEKVLDVFGSSTCALPCWNGIMIGETTEQEAMGYLSQVTLVDQESIVAVEIHDGLIDRKIRFKLGSVQSDGQHLVSGYLAISEEQIISMGFYGRIRLTVGEVFSTFGEPEDVYTTYSHSGDIDADLLIHQAGVIVEVRKSPRDDLTVDDNIQMIEIIDPRIYDTLIQERFTIDGQLTKFYKWDGLGKLEEKYDP